MPLLKTSQTHKCLNQPPYRKYVFADEHKKDWMTFWKAMDGDRDKILDFAEKSEIQNPKDWYEELHRFLFDFFAGDDKLLKKAAKKTFGEFLAQVAENHVNAPKDKYWYFGKGLKPKDFIRVIEFAAAMADPSQAISYINARTPEYGAKLYSEYILSKTPGKKEIESIASDLNKKAFLKEKELTGLDTFDIFREGDTVRHLRFANEEFKIVVADREHEMLVLEDSNGREAYVFDPWNLEKS